MTEATTLMHTRASAWRRHSILEAVVGSALLAVSVLSAIQAETWHAMLSGLAAGATLSAAVITFGKARLWERVAASRETKGE